MSADQFNLILGIFNVVALIVSIWISIWGIKRSELIAEKSGAFDKPELRLSFGGYFIPPHSHFDVFYGVDISDSSFHYVDLPIGIHNTGKKSLENAGVLLKYPHIAHIAQDNKYFKLESIFDEAIKRSFATVEPYDQVFIKFSEINPNFSMPANDLISIHRETNWTGTIPTTTKDSVKLSFTASIQFSYPVQIALTAKDVNTEQYNLSLNFKGESNADSLIRKIASERMKATDTRKSFQSFFVIVPAVEKVEKIGENKISFLNSDYRNTFFCKLDDSGKFLLLIGQDGTLTERIDMSTL